MILRIIFFLMFRWYWLTKRNFLSTQTLFLPFFNRTAVTSNIIRQTGPIHFLYNGIMVNLRYKLQWYKICIFYLSFIRAFLSFFFFYSCFFITILEVWVMVFVVVFQEINFIFVCHLLFWQMVRFSFLLLALLLTSYCAAIFHYLDDES